MTTVTVPNELLTIEDWDALEETDASRRWELADGVVVVNPFPSVGHQEIVVTLTERISEQLPADLRALYGIAVTIDPGFPPTVRGPDVTVFPRAVRGLNVLRLDPADVRLVVEIVSPGSRRQDRVTKLSEYREAGIPAYWIIDPAAQGDSRFVAYQLVGGVYKEVARGSGVISVDHPVPLTIDVGALLTLD